MEILFIDSLFAKECEDERKLNRAHGPECARKIRLRLTQIIAASDFAVLAKLPGARLHEHKGINKGLFTVDLDGPYRLMLEPDHEPLPTKADGQLDWSRVTRVRVLGIIDPH